MSRTDVRQLAINGFPDNTIVNTTAARGDAQAGAATRFSLYGRQGYASRFENLHLLDLRAQRRMKAVTHGISASPNLRRRLRSTRNHHFVVAVRDTLAVQLVTTPS